MQRAECYNRLNHVPLAEEFRPVQKLQEILHAEDSARGALEQAHEEAARIGRDAAGEAAAVRADGKRAANDAAKAHRDSVLSVAASDAAAIDAEAAAALAGTLVAARGAMPLAVAAVVKALTE